MKCAAYSYDVLIDQDVPDDDSSQWVWTVTDMRPTGAADDLQCGFLHDNYSDNVVELVRVLEYLGLRVKVRWQTQ